MEGTMEPKFKRGDRVFCNSRFGTWFVGTVRSHFKFNDDDSITYYVVITEGNNIMCPPEEYLSLTKRIKFAREGEHLK